MVKHLYLPLLLLFCIGTTVQAQTCQPKIGHAGLNSYYSLFEDGVWYYAAGVNSKTAFLDSIIEPKTPGNSFSVVSFNENMEIRWSHVYPWDLTKAPVLRFFKNKGQETIHLHVFLPGKSIDFGDTILKAPYPSCLYEISLDARTGKFLNAELLLYTKTSVPILGEFLSSSLMQDAGANRILSGIAADCKVYNGYDNTLLIDSLGIDSRTEYILLTRDKKKWDKIKVSYTKDKNQSSQPFSAGFYVSKNYFVWDVQYEDSLYLNDKLISHNPHRYQITNAPLPNTGILTGDLEGGDLVFTPFSGPTYTIAGVVQFNDDGSLELLVTSSNVKVSAGPVILPYDTFSRRFTGLRLSKSGFPTILYQASSDNKQFYVSPTPFDSKGKSYITMPDFGSFTFNGQISMAGNKAEKSVTLYQYDLGAKKLSGMLRAKSSADLFAGYPFSLAVEGANTEYIFLQSVFKGKITFPAGVSATGTSSQQNTAFVRFCLSDLPDLQVSVDVPRFITNIAAYPNPVRAGGRLELNGAPAGTRWVLTSAEGRQILLAAQAGIPAQWLSIPATAAPGLYILSGTSPEGALMRSKIIVR